MKSRKWLGAFRKGNENIIKVLESGELGCEYAYILHDKDKTDPHYHYCLWFNNPRSAKNLCEYFKLGDVENLWQVMRSDKYSIEYLTHKNDKGEKYKYDESDIKANFDIHKYDDIDNLDLYGDLQKLTPEEFVKKYDNELNKCCFYQKLKIFELLKKYHYNDNGDRHV